MKSEILDRIQADIDAAIHKPENILPLLSLNMLVKDYGDQCYEQGRQDAAMILALPCVSECLTKRV